MVNGKKIILFIFFLFITNIYIDLGITMEEKPYHHLSDGTFRNPEGSPKRDPDVSGLTKFSIRRKKNLI